MKTLTQRINRGLGFLLLLALVFSCSDRITREIKPSLGLEIIQAATDSSLSIRLEAFNPYEEAMEYGLMITVLDSMNDAVFFDETQTGAVSLNEVDLFFNAGNPMLENTRMKAIGTIKGGETIKLLDYVVDSIMRNSGYVIRAYMKGLKTLVYSRARSFRSSDHAVLSHLVTFDLPFSPKNFININDKVYMLGDKTSGNPSLFSYSLGANNYQTLANNPLNSTQYPKSSFAVVDDANKIHYFVQENMGPTRKYKRASYDPASNVWSNDGTTCSSGNDTSLIENVWAYSLKGRMVTSQIYNNSQYRMANSTPTDFCPLAPSQLITLVNCAADKFTLNVANAVYHNDTVYIPNQFGTSISYIYSPISQAFICGELNYSTSTFNPLQIFVFKGKIYSIVYTENPVNKRNELMLFRLSFPNNVATYRFVYNLSNSDLVQATPLQNGIIRHFTEANGKAYIFLQDGADPKRTHVYTFSE